MVCGKCCCNSKVAKSDDSEDQKGMKERNKRKCHDCLCCIFFILFWIGMITVGGLALRYGSPKRLIYGTDYRGKVCGHDDDVKDMKYISYPRTNEDFLVNYAVTDPLDYKFYGVCVRRCPKITMVNGVRIADIVCNDDAIAGSMTSYRNFLHLHRGEVRGCLENGTNPSSVSVSCFTMTENCWLIPLDTSSVFFRCIPVYEFENANTAKCVFPDGITDANSDACILVEENDNEQVVKPAKPNYLFDKLNQARNVWSRYFADLQQTWFVIVGAGVVVALALGFLWLVFLRCCAGVMVWLSILLVIVGMIALTLFCYFKAGILTNEQFDDISEKISGKEGSGEVSQELDSSEDYREAFKYTAFVLTAVTLIVICLVVALRNKINLAIKVVKKAATAMGANPCLIVLPVFLVMALLALAAYFLFIAAALASAGEITTAQVEGNVQESLNELQGTPGLNDLAKFNESASVAFKNVEEFDWSKYMLAYHFFGFLWSMQFIHGIGVMTIAITIAGWYFSKVQKGDTQTKKYDQPRFATFVSCGMVFRYYLGTIAFGSFLIAFIQFLRACLAYIKRQMEKHSNGNRLIRTCMCCLQCCLWCIQKIVEVVTRNSYILAGIKDLGFCAAGKGAFRLFREHFLKLAVVNAMAEVLMFLSKLFVACASAFVCFWILDNEDRFQEGGENEISSTWLPVLLTFILAFVVASAFFAVCDAAIDTILICYIVDSDEHDGVPVHMSEDAFTYYKKKKGKGRRDGDEDEANGSVEMRTNPAHKSA